MGVVLSITAPTLAPVIVRRGGRRVGRVRARGKRRRREGTVAIGSGCCIAIGGCVAIGGCCRDVVGGSLGSFGLGLFPISLFVRPYPDVGSGAVCDVCTHAH